MSIEKLKLNIEKLKQFIKENESYYKYELKLEGHLILYITEPSIITDDEVLVRDIDLEEEMI